MTTLSICFTGLSREEESAVVSCFKQANARLGNRWLATPESEAGVLVIDMDSMYGQMSLMKALGTGRVLVALTASGRAETDYVLQRPVTVDALVALLGQIDLDTPEPEAEAEPAFHPPADAAAPAAPVQAAPAADPEPPSAPAVAPPMAVPPESAGVSTPPEPAVALPAQSRLADLLRTATLAGAVKLQLPDAPELVLDPATQTYLGGAALKPLLPYCSRAFSAADLQPVAASELPALAARMGGSQPWSRLAWLCALTGGNGALAEGHGPNEKYRLLKWPQTEREFPKHFRIATVMMKGPAELMEISQASGASLAEVIDFVNASLATGAAEPETAAVVGVEPGKGGGLLGRFRR
ncbi:MAG: hypothetical protein KA187_04145 [Arenimonas sp.]|nr:hypothetical protein [Arenimonas sp.]